MDPAHDNVALSILLTGRVEYRRGVLEVGIEVRINNEIQLFFKFSPAVLVLK